MWRDREKTNEKPPYDDLIVERTREYVIALFTRRNCTDLIYHNLAHTKSVVDHAIEIAAQYPVTEQELYYLTIAAWFHDTGHLFGELKNHEEAGVHLMGALMQTFEIPENIIGIIADCILSTKMPTHPQSLIEKIICDADTYHLGTPEFRETNEKVWKEFEIRFSNPIEHPVEKAIWFLTSHKYYTDYCRDLLNPGKEENIGYLKKQLNK